MAKEVSLKDLMGSTTNEKVSVQEFEVNETKQEQKTEEPAKVNMVSSTENIKGGKEVSIGDLSKNLPGKEEEVTKDNSKTPELVEDAFKSMIETMENKKKKFDTEVRPKLEEAAAEKEIDDELNELLGDNSVDDGSDLMNEILNESDEDDSEENKEEFVESVPDLDNVSIPASEIKASNVVEYPKSDLQEEEESIEGLLKALEEEDTEDDFEVESIDDEETIEETRERLKKSMGKLVPKSNSIDLSGYSLGQKPLSSSTVLNKINSNKVVKKADWALLATGISITMTEATGPELETLEKNMRSRNNVNAVIESIRFLYNHLEDANKPSFEAWTKLISYEDLESLYFALYKACYSDVNLIGRTCEKNDNEKDVTKKGCGKTSVIDTDINRMAKFEDKETEELFNKLLQHDTTSYKTNKKSNIIPVSDSIVISYSDPTIYNTLIQFSSLSENIVQKYSELLNTMAYIDGFFYIDSNNKNLVPISIKTYPDNLNKTVISKLKVYSDILKTLTSDEYAALVTKISENANKESKITYVLPESSCPECGATIPEEPAGSMLDLLFTHRQLTAIANS